MRVVVHGRLRPANQNAGQESRCSIAKIAYIVKQTAGNAVLYAHFSVYYANAISRHTHFMVNLGSERDSHALAADLLAPARAAGWLGSTYCAPHEALGGVCFLYIGGQAIPIRRIIWQPGIDPFVARLVAEVQVDAYLEQFILLVGFSVEQRIAVAEQLRHPYRRLWSGDIEDYSRWLVQRIGPLGRLAASSPVRQLLEPFWSYSGGIQPAPPARVPLVGQYGRSSIKASFDLGALGVQACTTLLHYIRGGRHVVNVEESAEWQAKDVDLLVTGLAGGLPGAPIRVEVKNENYRSGNLTLEDISNQTKGTPGWLRYSEAEVLVGCTWPTGDLFFMDFKRVQHWVYHAGHGLAVREGTAPGQTYRSRIFLAPVTTLLTVFDDAFYLRLSDWLPKAYGNQFAFPSLVPEEFRHRKLTPQ